jgi:hypothetical protein
LFNQQENDDTDFCESYKSQVLGKDVDKTSTSLFSTIIKLLIILILLAIIAGVSFYGYNYFIHNQKVRNDLPIPPVSIQVSEEDLVVTHLDEPDNQVAKEELNNTEKVTETNNTVEENETSQTNQPKEEISLEVPVPTPEAQYLEELADLSKEIDKERKK